MAQLARVRGWLAQHPDDVVTLILEDDVPFADVQATLTAAGLDPWLATPPVRGGAWPTLRQMVDRKQTLMVFTQTAKPDQGPVRNFYQLAAETPFEADSPASLSCAPGRGSVTAPLFLINNWVTMTIPTKAVASSVNSPTFLSDRVQRCDSQRGMLANFVAVDFSDTGDPLEVVQALNGTRSPLS